MTDGGERPDPDERRAAGWVLPHALATGSRPMWTLVGTVDSSWITAVDPCGLVTPFSPGSRWSLDWWVGADDHWHLPSTGAGVRQQLVGAAPVVETLLRVPGGDTVQRVYGMRGEAFEGGDEWVVVEVENRSSLPFAIAFAVRPVTPEHLTSLQSIAMVPVGGGQGRDAAHGVSIDGRAALVFPRRPALVAASSAADGDVAAVVCAGGATPLTQSGPWTGVTCADGSAQAAFVFPVAHTAVVRVALPLGAVPASAARWPQVIPPVSHVAAGWDAHVGRAVRTVLPDSLLADAAAVAGRSILLAPWSDGVRLAGSYEERPAMANELADTAAIVAALDRAGHHADVARTLRRWPNALTGSGRRSLASDVALLDAVGTHLLLAGDQPLFDELLPDVVAAVARLDRAGSRAARDQSVPPGAVRSLMTAAAALEVVGQSGGAAEVRSVATRIARDEEREPPVPSSVAAEPRALLRAAAGALFAGEAAGVDLLARALRLASPTFAFADQGHPQDLVSAALLLDAVRALLVRERDDGLELLPVFPPHWFGAPVELHRAPTAHGRLSYALRWHGTRPAVLWELDRPPGQHDVRLSMPGLDPAWTTTAAKGEALLGEIKPPVGLAPAAGGSFT